MKKFMAMILALTMVLSLTGCNGLFSNTKIVKLNGDYTHEDPKDLKYDERIVLKKDGYDADIENAVNAAAYPDTMMYDEEGNVIGMYDYDETTGLATGWTNMADGTHTEFTEDEIIDLGKPDTSLMIDIKGTVNLGIVLYGNEEKAVESHMYFFLSDAADKELVKTNLETMMGFEITEVSDTVLKTIEDADVIAGKFKEAEEYGQVFDKKDARTYANNLKALYGVKEDGGVNPYKAYEGHEDPTDITFDEKVVYTASGKEAFMPEDGKDVICMTNYVYAKDGVVIADYTYYETETKEEADALMEIATTYFTNPQRASDTAILVVLAGEEMESYVSQMIGYTVMADNSLAEYIKMLEGTYFSMEYK